MTRQQGITYISVDDGWGVVVQVFETLGNIEHQAKLDGISKRHNAALGDETGLTTLFSGGHGTLRYSISRTLPSK